MVDLGSYVRDEYSGYTGYVTGRCVYLDRSPLCLVVSDRVENGGTKEEWIPERRLKCIEKNNNSIGRFTNTGRAEALDNEASDD